MSEVDSLKAEILGLKHAVGHIRLWALEAQLETVAARAEWITERRLRLQYEIDFQREALGLAPAKGNESIRQLREKIGS